MSGIELLPLLSTLKNSTNCIKIFRKKVYCRSPYQGSNHVLNYINDVTVAQIVLGHNLCVYHSNAEITCLLARLFKGTLSWR